MIVKRGHLSKIFAQAVTGLVLTASLASMAHAVTPAPAEGPRDNNRCQVNEQVPGNGLSMFGDFPTINAYNYDSKTITHVSPRDGTVKLSLAEAGAEDKAKYEAMKKKLPPVCKEKLGFL